MTAILEMRGVSKSFSGVQALRDVNFTVEAGQIHALVGENGAGKSTLMKVLSGVYPHGDYEGGIIFDGEERRFRDVNDSEALGIIIIHQELALIPLMSIAENIFLSHPPSRLGVIDRDTVYSRTQELLAQVGLTEMPDTLVTDLGVGKQQHRATGPGLDDLRNAAGSKSEEVLAELGPGFRAGDVHAGLTPVVLDFAELRRQAANH
jgi:putative multiple sugar transport system ATP-binding protein